MQFTVAHIAELLKISVEQVDSVLKEAGIILTEGRPLTAEESGKLKLLVFRRYTLKRPKTSSEYPNHPQDDSSATPQQATNNSHVETPFPHEVAEKSDVLQTPVPNGAQSAMEELARNYVMMIDTCSLMHDKCEIMIAELLPALQKAHKRLIVPEKVMLELKKLRNDASDPLRSAYALEGLKICQKLRDVDCLSIRGNKSDNFADNVFFVYFSHYRDRYRLLLITQDQGLTHDILQLNGVRSSNGYPVKVMHITKQGKLEESELYDFPF